jgi:hypothetical protein
MRRPVQARVRFVQELGRVLRVHPEPVRVASCKATAATADRRPQRGGKHGRARRACRPRDPQGGPLERARRACYGWPSQLTPWLSGRPRIARHPRW